MLDGFGKWDARYFLSIARFGYDSEKWIAFFPLYPLLIRHTTTCISLLLDLSYPYSHLLSGYLISNIFFVISAVSLFRLTVRLHRDRQFALRTIKWFCYNPASVFFSACYTESVYSAFVMAALCLLHDSTSASPSRRRVYILVAGILLCCASFTRSNGITNTLFILYPLAYENFTFLVNRQFAKCFTLDRLLITIITMLSAVLVALPYVIVQINAHDLFCDSMHPSRRSAICDTSPLTMYSNVQRMYWDVGFGRYYMWRKLPMFLLALPVTMIVGQIWMHFWRENSLVLRRNFLNWSSFKYKRQDEFWNRIEILLPYLLHITFLTSFAWCCINVEVITRLLASSTPLIYWSVTAFDKRSQFWTKCFFAVYFWLGIALHTNFLPWT